MIPYYIYIILVILVTVSTTDARPISDLRHPCPVPSIDQVEKLVGAGWDIIAMKYWRTFDLDGDRRPDYHLEYDIRGIKEDKRFDLTPFPVTYYLDTDHDGVYDAIYIDMQGNGRCEDLRPYIGREMR